MKARFLALAALVLGLASCQNDFEAGNAVAGGEVDFQLYVDANELATRAGQDGNDTLNGWNSAYGAIDYLKAEADALRYDWTDVDLRYTLEVYDVTKDADGNNVVTNLVPVKDRQVIIKDSYEPVVFSLRLAPHRDYRFVVFADFVGQGATDKPTVADQANIGLRHTIGNTLQEITVKENDDDNKWLNDEVADAYFAFEDIEITNSNTLNMVLRRPYGKLRVIATDLAELNLNVEPNKVKVTYTAANPNKFNAVTGEIEVDNTPVEYVIDYNSKAGKTSMAEYTYTEGYDAKTVTNDNGDIRHSHITLFTDYILAVDTQEPIHFTMTVNDGDGNLIKETAFNTEIPIQRNYLTTVIGNVLTTATEVEVTINDNFSNGTEWNPEEDDLDIEIVEVADQASFMKALEEAAKKEYATIELTGNVEWETGASHGSTPLIGADGKTQSLTIYGNGRELKATGKGVGPIRLANGGKLIFQDVVFVDESVSYNEGAWELGYLEFAGELEFINCEFKNAVMMCGGTANNDTGANATFTGCKFNSGDANQYDVWVSGDNAYFNECTFEGYRGIKVHEAYGSEVTEVEVDNCLFNNLSKKPGMAIGTMNAETAITIKNSIFTNCQPGDQGLYIYETDTDVTTFDFNEENNVINFSIEDNTTLDEVLKANNTHISVDLTEDAIVEVSAWNDPYYLGGADTETITINGNGHTLTFNHNNTDWNYVRCANENTKLIIKNAKLSNSGENNGPWNRHDITFNNPVVLEDVTSDKAIALLANADLTNVVISDVHVDNSDAYALWIRPTGQTVNIKDCQLIAHSSKSGDRGIKIDNQYDDTPVKATLNVDGLKVKSQKKAAIVVKCPVGAEINLQNIDITEVAEDRDFAVWVDEDAAAYADLVTVTGGLKKVEGSDDAVVGSQNDFNAAVVEGATIYLNEGTYNMPSTGGKDITIVGDKDVIINAGAANMGSGNVTLEGVTITAGSYKGFQHSGVVTYNNVTIQGQLNCYGNEDIFNGCTFELDNTYVWTYGSKKTVFNECTFNTTGKAILIYNEGAGACNVEVTNCTFNATAGAKAGAIANQNCAAIEIDNYAKMAHKLTTSGNTVDNEFSGEWRIKSYVEGAPVTVNGVEYTYIAVDGKKMTIDGDKNVTVVE